MTEPTDADRRKAGSMLLNMHGKELPMRASIIAAALAEAREKTIAELMSDVEAIQGAHQRTIARLGQQEARHEVELRALQSQIADLAQERDRLRGALKAPGLYPPTETPEAVAARHIKGVDQDPPLQPAEEPGP